MEATEGCLLNFTATSSPTVHVWFSCLHWNTRPTFSDSPALDTVMEMFPFQCCECPLRVDRHPKQIKMLFKCSRLDVNVLWVSAVELIKEKHSVWILAFCSSWLWDFSHRHPIFSSLRLQQPPGPRSDSGPDPCSVEGKNFSHQRVISDCGFSIRLLSEPSWMLPSQDLEVLSCALRWLLNSSKWLVKLWNIRDWFPALPDFSSQCKSVRKVSLRPLWLTLMSCHKVPQFAGEIIFFFFFWKNLSNKTRISFKITRKNIHKYIFTIYYVLLHKLFKKSFNTRLPFQKCSHRKCRHHLT